MGEPERPEEEAEAVKADRSTPKGEGVPGEKTERRFAQSPHR